MKRFLAWKVTAVLQSSEFLAGPKSVSIMDGQDEGIYAWMTVNFLEGEDLVDK